MSIQIAFLAIAALAVILINDVAAFRLQRPPRMFKNLKGEGLVCQQATDKIFVPLDNASMAILYIIPNCGKSGGENNCTRGLNEAHAFFSQAAAATSQAIAPCTQQGPKCVAALSAYNKNITQAATLASNAAIPCAQQTGYNTPCWNAVDTLIQYDAPAVEPEVVIQVCFCY